MNYKKNYYDYIKYVKQEMKLGNRPKNRKDMVKNFKEVYYEFHHIKPICLGGSNSSRNLVALTAREHFLAHYLLMKIHPNNYKIGLAFASFIRNINSNHSESYFNWQLFNLVKDKIDYGATSRNTKRSKEFCKTLSKALKGREFTEEHKKHISKNHHDVSGKNNPMYGKKHSKESKKKMSKNQKKAFTKERRAELSNYAKTHYNGKGNPRARRVRCLENGKEFDTILEAAIWVHGSAKSKASISWCCKGIRNTAFGYHWEYVDNIREE